MIKKILVPIDGSEQANRALEFALDLAQKYSAEILILTVVEHPNDVTYAAVLGKGYFQKAQAFHEKILTEAVEKAKKAVPRLTITSKLAEGYPTDRIIETAHENNCDLIVMGRRGQGHLKHTMLGSVSDRVADQTHSAIFIIK